MRGWPDKDFYTEVVKGNVPGHSIIHKFGRSAVVPNGSFVFVEPLGLTAWPLSSATTIRIKAGGNVNDTAAGSGAREITVQGLDANGLEIEEAITTNGASASTATTASFFRVYRAWVSEVGTYGAANADDIVIENGAGGTDITAIMADEGQTQITTYTIPANKTGHLISISTTVDSNQTADIRFFTRENVLDTSTSIQSKRLKYYFDGVVGGHNLMQISPQCFQPLTDVWAEASGAAAGTEVSVNYEMLLINNYD